jgi:hypothetical protein
LRHLLADEVKQPLIFTKFFVKLGGIEEFKKEPFEFFVLVPGRRSALTNYRP